MDQHWSVGNFFPPCLVWLESQCKTLTVGIFVSQCLSTRGGKTHVKVLEMLGIIYLVQRQIRSSVKINHVKLKLFSVNHPIHTYICRVGKIWVWIWFFQAHNINNKPRSIKSPSKIRRVWLRPSLNGLESDFGVELDFFIKYKIIF